MKRYAYIYIMKVCKECGEKFDVLFRNANSRYCSDKCRKTVRNRVQKKYREKRRNRIKFNDKPFICNYTYKKYKQRAPKRGLSFSLSLDFFKKHIDSKCYFCNQSYNGIGFDRLDNGIGYHEENCVPCCKDCNMMKRATDVDDFINKCKEIASNF